MAKGLLPVQLPPKGKPETRVFKCCPQQQGLLLSVGGKWFATRVYADGKTVHYFSDRVTICRGCGKPLPLEVVGSPYQFGVDAGLDEHILDVLAD